jgi:hypothetical protein
MNLKTIQSNAVAFRQTLLLDIKKKIQRVGKLRDPAARGAE